MSERCKQSPMGGGRCELEQGHDGKHRRTSYPRGTERPPFVFEWTDESQTALIAKHGSRFD